MIVMTYGLNCTFLLMMKVFRHYFESAVVNIRTTDGDCQSMGKTGIIDGHGLTLASEISGQP